MKRNGVNYQKYRHCFRQNHIPVFVTLQHAISQHAPSRRHKPAKNFLFGALDAAVTIQQGRHPLYCEQAAIKNALYAFGPCRMTAVSNVVWVGLLYNIRTYFMIFISFSWRLIGLPPSELQHSQSLAL
jgi:hypothetical protein